MASLMIGRTACPECGFASAHVKQSEKCLYRFCPECSSQHHARTERQRTDLMAKTRLVDGGQPTPTPTPRADTPPPPPPPDKKPTPTPRADTPSPPPPAKKPGGLFF